MSSLEITIWGKFFEIEKWEMDQMKESGGSGTGSAITVSTLAGKKSVPIPTEY